MSAAPLAEPVDPAWGYDALIIGGGIAGCLLAWELRALGRRARILDAPVAGAASAVAAGLVNPISGPRLALVPMAEEFLSAARRTYRTLSEQLGLEVFSQRLILRQTQSPADREAARHRLAVPGSGRWLRRYDEDTLEIRHGGQVDIPGLIGSMRAFLEPQGCWSARSIRPEELVETPAGVETDGFRASVAVLAVGWRACEWSHANALPWTPAKGVMIDLECALSEGDAVRIASHWVAPVSGGRVLRCGATFERDFGDLRPSDRSRLDLESSATELLRRPVVTRQILVGVRPIAQDRKPVLGALSTRSRIVHFNGLGSRGALQGPYWARHLARSLVLGEPLARDVAATRFLPR